MSTTVSCDWEKCIHRDKDKICQLDKIDLSYYDGWLYCAMYLEKAEEKDKV